MRARNRNAVPRRTLFLALISIGAVLSSLTWARPAQAQTVWTGPSISFTKPDGADPTLPANQDAIVPGVSITRGNTRGLYNIAVEGFFLLGTSPADTEWAWGLNNPALPDSEIRAANHVALQFDDWTTAHGQQPLATLGRPGVLHIVSQNIYIDITMTAWTSLGSGGGFAYTRSTPPPRPVPTIRSIGQALGTIAFAIWAGLAAQKQLLARPGLGSSQWPAPSSRRS